MANWFKVPIYSKNRLVGHEDSSIRNSAASLHVVCGTPIKKRRNLFFSLENKLTLDQETKRF